MSFEADLQQLIATATGKDVYWDTTPDNYRITSATIILQQVGGKASWYLEKESMPSHKHARVQATVWALSRAIAAPISRLIENTIALGPYVSEPYGAAVGISNPTLTLFGQHQQFGMWYPDP